jgi:hypothetical protein
MGCDDNFIPDNDGAAEEEEVVLFPADAVVAVVVVAATGATMIVNVSIIIIGIARTEIIVAAVAVFTGWLLLFRHVICHLQA